MVTDRGVILAGLVALAACTPRVVPTGTQQTGAAAPRLAVEQFLAAARAEDIQALGAIWGSSRGPAQETMERTELERRAVILQCFVAHDSYRIIGESPGEGGRRIFRVQLVRGQHTRQTNFTAIAGPRQRWYVESVDLASIRDFCGQPMPQPPPA